MQKYKTANKIWSSETGRQKSYVAVFKDYDGLNFNFFFFLILKIKMAACSRKTASKNKK